MTCFLHVGYNTLAQKELGSSFYGGGCCPECLYIANISFNPGTYSVQVNRLPGVLSSMKRFCGGKSFNTLCKGVPHHAQPLCLSTFSDGRIDANSANKQTGLL